MTGYQLVYQVPQNNFGHALHFSTALLVGGFRDWSPVTGDFFRDTRQFHVPWGRLSLYK